MQCIWVKPDAEGVRSARGDTSRQLARLGVRDADHDVLLVLVSELLTNALMHGEPPIMLSIGRSGQACRIEVADASGTMPALRTRDVTRGGHGLHLVNQLASSWGVETTAHGKYVWLELHDVLPRPTIERWIPTRDINPPRIATPA